MRLVLITLISCLLFLKSFGQENYPIFSIKPKLLKNANAVIRNQHLSVEITDVDRVVLKTTRTVTVLNKFGDRYARAYEFYDENSKVKAQEAIIQDATGTEISKFKKRDFKDKSSFASFILFADNRLSYLDYTPRNYPYTITYTSEKEYGNTAFLPDFSPVDGYYISVASSSYEVLNKKNIPLRFLEKAMDTIKVERSTSDFELRYSVKNLPAYEHEKFSPDIKNIAPRLLIALDEFYLEGVSGKASNWKDFGSWQFQNLIQDHDQLSQETIDEVTGLSANAKNDEEKARIIYEYVQNKTRYIAVMLGIGGWEPAQASDVDRLGYGDCKGLTNYTKALLASQGITSYYTIIHADKAIQHMDPEFTAMQGNHVILNIPQEGNDSFWLECTSQTAPFNYLGSSTDNRYALVVKPEGGELVKTKMYSEADNLRSTICEVQLDADGGFEAVFSRDNYGIPYGEIYGIETENERNRQLYYKNDWSHLQNLQFQEIAFENDKKAIAFSENLQFSGERLASKAGERLLLPLLFNSQEWLSLGNDENRKLPLEILRGRTYKDEFVYKLPQGYQVEALPKNMEIRSEFGLGTLQVKTAIIDGTSTIFIDRNLVLKSGKWPPSKYKEFQKFAAQLNSLNNQKAVLISN